MKILKTKDFFVFFYMFNWLISLIMLPLSKFVGMLMLFTFFQTMSSGDPSFMNTLFVLGLVLGILGLAYLVLYLVFALRSLIQSLKEGRESFYLAPISLMLILIIQFVPPLLVLMDQDLLDTYKSLIALAQIFTILPFVGYLYGRYGRKGGQASRLLWVGHILNALLVLVVIVGLFAPMIPQLTRTGRVLDSLEQAYRKAGMDAKVDIWRGEGYHPKGPNDMDFEHIYPVGEVKVSIGRFSFEEEIRVNQWGGIEQVAFLDSKSTPTPLLRYILKKGASQDNLIRVKKQLDRGLEDAGRYVSDSPNFGDTEVSTFYISNPQRSEAQSFKDKDFQMDKIFQLFYPELLEKEDVLTLVRIKLEKTGLDSNEEFIKGLDYRQYLTGRYIFEIEETDRDNGQSKEQFEVQIKDGKFVQLKKGEGQQDLTKGAATLLKYESGGSTGYAIRDGFDHLVDWPY